MKKQIIICCPSSENMTGKDKKEIYNLLVFKEWYKNFLKRNKEREVKENDRH